MSSDASHEIKPSLRERFADAVTKGMGTWKFVVGQAVGIAAWITLNTTHVLPFIPQWDPNLILLNLALSTEAAFAGAFILMSQNRQSERDRQTFESDYLLDIESDKMIKALNRKIDLLIASLTPEQLKAAEAAAAAAGLAFAVPAPDDANAPIHVHPPEEKPTLSQRFADAATRGMGSWGFIISQAVTITAWIGLNTTNVLPIPHWDPNLILLNLALSSEAALSAAFILMSQRRQSEKDRLIMQNDYKVDQAASKTIKELNLKVDFLISALVQPKPVEAPKPSANDNVEAAQAAIAAAKPVLKAATP